MSQLIDTYGLTGTSTGFNRNLPLNLNSLAIALDVYADREVEWLSVQTQGGLPGGEQPPLLPAPQDADRNS